ncbi:MAG: peptide-methionine (S)-S-oxide reductase MsrA [Methanobacteriota archaeon]
MKEIATFGGGCFWCLEAVYSEIRGVEKVVSGYAGGHSKGPTYEEVCEGDTGHAEVVQVTFDPSVVTYRDLLGIFFSIHDPTTPDRQGADVGTQYRSVIFHHSDEQRSAAEAIVRELSDEKVFEDPIVTEVAPAPRFYPAEDYHQQYYRRNPAEGYCRAVIAPKLAKFRAKWAMRVKRQG